MAWFNFVRRRQPNGGAQEFGLTEFRSLTWSAFGNGVNAGALSVTQPPQLWQGLSVPVAGFGGPQAGQMVGQPLFDLGSQGVNTTDLFPD